jgi:hypothetical protein
MLASTNSRLPSLFFGAGTEEEGKMPVAGVACRQICSFSHVVQQDSSDEHKNKNAPAA